MRRAVIAFILAAGALVSCTKESSIPQPKPTGGGTDPGTVTPTTHIGTPTNHIVAHRGGSAECGYPDNSRASLQYAMKLGLYGSECDIYWTHDNNVVIAHANSEYKINGLTPWTSTVEQIRKAGKLKNGEEIPVLDDFLDIVMVEGGCTKLVLDIKNLSSDLTAYPIKAVQRACEIIKDRGAQEFCEFICTGNGTVGTGAVNCMNIYKIPIGWMSQNGPATHKAKGFTWANLPATIMVPAAGGTGSLTVDDFINAGMEISIFNLDQKSGDGNAVYSETALNYYKEKYPKMKFICTNYPNWLLNQLK